MTQPYFIESATSQRTSTESRWPLELREIWRASYLSEALPERSETAYLSLYTRPFKFGMRLESSAVVNFPPSLRQLYELLHDQSTLSKDAISPQLLEQAVRELFSSIPQVVRIYQDEQGDEILFWIFTNNEKYDDELMELLISREEALMDTHPQADIWIRYIPLVLCDNPREVVGDTARLIFER